MVVSPSYENTFCRQHKKKNVQVDEKMDSTKYSAVLEENVETVKTGDLGGVTSRATVKMF